MADHADRNESTNHPGQRAVPRYPFVATAVVTELRSEARLPARTSELSIHGCYIDTLNPFPAGTDVRVKIIHGNRTFETPAQVVYIHPGYGMGLLFAAAPAEQQPVLEDWLRELAK